MHNNFTEVSHESGAGEVRLKTGDGCARKPLTNTNSDTNLTSTNSNSNDRRGGGEIHRSPADKTFTCERNGIDGFISAVDRVIDRVESDEPEWGDSDTAAELSAGIQRGCL